VTWKSTPLDSPLFVMESERCFEYWGCRAVMATLTVGGEIADFVPRGLHLDDPAFGVVLVADDGARTIGPYGEYVSILRVVEDDGVPGFYIPYNYVTNEAALDAGLETLGAPKKLAAVTVDLELAAADGTLCCPDDCVLTTVVVAFAERMQADLSDALLPAGTTMYSLRHLPGPSGATQAHELVRWTATSPSAPTRSGTGCASPDRRRSPTRGPRWCLPRVRHAPHRGLGGLVRVRRRLVCRGGDSGRGSGVGPVS
jgi:acetoacetate decarboxylase